MFDLVIRGGSIADGTGRPVFTGDVAIRNGKIAEVGGHVGPGQREIDATGLLVCPGFIDTHTHFDGQVTWDPHLAPSSWHGVTTVIMGNCGVGFAPVRPGQKEYLIDVMEGVEDIPGSALAEGMPWDWETFPEYLDTLDRFPRSIDVAAQVPHCAVRAYVMGRGRALDDDTTADDVAQMAEITRDAIKAGAVGFSTSRTFIHLSKSGELIPGTHCHPEELMGIAHGMAEAGSGVFQMISDSMGKEPDRHWMKEICKITGRPFIFSMVDVRANADPLRVPRYAGSARRDLRNRRCRYPRRRALASARISHGAAILAAPFQLSQGLCRDCEPAAGAEGCAYARTLRSAMRYWLTGRTWANR